MQRSASFRPASQTETSCSPACDGIMLKGIKRWYLPGVISSMNESLKEGKVLQKGIQYSVNTALTKVALNYRTSDSECDNLRTKIRAVICVSAHVLAGF